MQDGSGGRVVTLPHDSPIVYANVPASIQDTGSKEMDIQGRLVNVLTHSVYTPTKMSLMNGDFILFGPTRVLIIQTFRDVSQVSALYLIGTIEYMVLPLV